MPLYVLAKIENFMLFMYFLFSSGAFKGNSNGLRRHNFFVQGSTGRPKGKLGISWNTVCEYICADVSSDVSMRESKKKAQTYAREADGTYISVGGCNGRPTYACSLHLNCPKRRRVVYEPSKCVVQEIQEEHSTEVNPHKKTRGKAS